MATDNTFIRLSRSVDPVSMVRNRGGPQKEHSRSKQMTAEEQVPSDQETVALRTELEHLKALVRAA